MKKKGQLTITLISICGFLLMLWFIVPSIKLMFTYVPIAIASALLLAAAFLFDASNRKKYLQIIFICALLAILYFLVPYFFNFKNSLNIFQQIVIFSAPAVLSLFIISHFNVHKEYNIVIQIFKCIGVVLFIYITIQTLNAMNEHPNVCRLLASSKEVINGYVLDEFRERNVGGFGFSYSLAFLYLFLLNNIFLNRKFKRVLYICLTVFIVWLIILTHYATLFILCASFTFVVIEKYSSGNKKLVLPAIILFITTISLLILFILGANKMNFEESPIYHVISIFSNDELSTSLRSQYWRDCLNLFSKNFLFGVSNIKNDVLANSVVINSHSTQLKILVETGIVGSLVYNFYLLTLKRFISVQLNIKGYESSLFKTAFYLFWVLSWFNPVYEVFELSFTLFLFIPLLSCNENMKLKTIGEELEK